MRYYSSKAISDGSGINHPDTLRKRPVIGEPPIYPAKPPDLPIS
jgi:hypothetical protein